MPTIDWNSDADWDQFTEVAVSGQDGSPPDNELILTGAGGVGTATGTGGSHTNDRRLYVLDGVQGSDWLVHCDFALDVQQAQFGIVTRVHEPPPVGDVSEYDDGGALSFCAAQREQLAARAAAFADPGAAPIAWTNIIFTADAMAISGVWEFAGNQLTDTNQTDDAVPAQDQAITSADGDGTTVTVVSSAPHCLQAGQLVNLDFGPFDGTTLEATVVNPTTFTVQSSEVGSWNTGRWRLLFVPIVKDPAPWRTLAVRTTGDSMEFKQWFPDCESEPAWGDPFRSATMAIPNVLDASGDHPPASGGFGLAITHMGPDRSLRVRNLDFTVLA